jgi:hypothetical protein
LCFESNMLRVWNTSPCKSLIELSHFRVGETKTQAGYVQFHGLPLVSSCLALKSRPNLSYHLFAVVSVLSFHHCTSSSFILNIKMRIRPGRVAQVVDLLPSKHKALSSSPSTEKEIHT